MPCSIWWLTSMKWLTHLLTQLHPCDRADPYDGFAHLVVRGRGAGGDADSTRGTQPIIATGLRLGADRLVANRSGGYVDGVGVLDVKSGNAMLVYQCRKVTRVAGVVPAYHDHQVERLLKQGQDRVLPFLGGRADRVEGAEVLLQRVDSIAPGDTLLHLFRDGERLPRQHCGLIGHTYAAQIALEIESRRDSPGKVGPEELDVAGTLDVIADHPGFVHVEDHEIAALRIFHDLARRGLGLFVIVLAVDEGGITVPGVALDPLPHVEHRSTGGVDQHAANAAKPLEVANGDAECRHDYYVIRADLGEVELTLRFLGEEGNAHCPKFLVDMGIVNDFPD